MSGARIGGIDEVGRGPLAGPVVVAGVVLYDGAALSGSYRDSKKLSARRRAALVPEIVAEALDYAIVEIPARVIDEINIREATRFGMQLVANTIDADRWLIDGNMGFEHSQPQTLLIGGDATHKAISAASIIAKEHRDCVMRNFSSVFVEYGFEKHVGYPTAQHKAALIQHGTSPLHRKSFRGVSGLQDASRYDAQLYAESEIRIFSLQRPEGSVYATRSAVSSTVSSSGA